MQPMRPILALSGVATVCGAVVLAYHQVPDRPTPADVSAIDKILPETLVPPRSFGEEVALILRIQDRVLAASPEERGIPLNQPREIGDLLKARYGACFDRSRAIETALRSYGFRTRHASMYSTAETGSALLSLLTPDIWSHALTEVKTARGWMVVDSKVRWIALTSDGKPLDLAALREDPARKWSAAARAPLPDIYGVPYTWVYGLYSRHGRFYPPYDAIPDVNWKELAQNL
jgi:hypothetical protein